MPDQGVLRHRAAADTALRSRSGALAYPVILGIIGAFTPYLSDHPLIFTNIGIIIVLATIVRLVCSLWFQKLYTFNPDIWYRANMASIISLALAWGVLSMMSIYYYSWNWTTMVTCLSAAAFSAGAVTAFSNDLRLVSAYLLVMFIPTLVATAVSGDQQSLTATFLFGVYFIFLLNIAKRLNKEYWSALVNTFLLDERASELESKNQELESFAYSVSHDLRAPLRTIDGFSRILYEDTGHKLDKEEMDYLRRMRHAAQRMGNLIDDLLELSRISRSKFRPKKIDLSKLAQSKIEKLRQLEPDREVEFDIETGVKACADSMLVDVALENLLSNAWKFSSKKPHSKIRFATTMVNGETAYFVKDNGVGFDTRYVDKLFSPFQRLHHNEEFPGTGIGLATVKRVIEKHGGRVWANAKIDKGATFYFTVNGQGQNTPCDDTS